jgi:hypothetical protein
VPITQGEIERLLKVLKVSDVPGLRQRCFLDLPTDRFQRRLDRDRLSTAITRIEHAATDIHRGAWERGSVAVDSAWATGGYAGDRVS